MQWIGDEVSWPRGPAKPKIVWMKMDFNLVWNGYYELTDFSDRDHNRILLWCQNNCIGKYSVSPGRHKRRIYFRNESDVIAFKLRWM